MKTWLPVASAHVALLLSAGFALEARADEPTEKAAPTPNAPPAGPEKAPEKAPEKKEEKKEEPLPPIPKQRISYDTTFGVRLNPLGLELQYNLAYRHRLYASDSRALRDNYFGIVVSPTFTPSIIRLGGTIEFRPLTMLNLSAGFHFAGYVGTFDNIASYETADADFSDTGRDLQGEGGRAYPTHGFEAFARAVALAKVGPIVIRDDLIFTYTTIELLRQDRLYYHPRFDVLTQNEGWFLHNDTDIAWLSDFGLLLGVRNSLTHAFYSDELLGGPASEDNVPMERLGPIAAYTIFDKPGAMFNKPTIIAFAQWWLLHRFRTGEDVHQGIPYATVAFRFEGDLWKTD